MSDFLDEIKRKRGWRFRLRLWWYGHVTYRLEQRQWKRAVKVIRDWDYYVISDHDYFRGVDAGLWDDENA